MLFHHAVVAANAAANMKAQLEEEKRKKAMQARKPRKQGWYKPGTGPPVGEKGLDRTDSLNTKDTDNSSQARSMAHSMSSSGASSRAWTAPQPGRSPRSPSNRSIQSLNDSALRKMTSSVRSSAREPSSGRACGDSVSASSVVRRKSNNSDSSSRRMSNNSGASTTRRMSDNSGASATQMNDFSSSSVQMNSKSEMGYVPETSRSEGRIRGLSSSSYPDEVSLIPSMVSEMTNNRSISDAIVDALDNDKLNDVTLTGRGDAHVRAIKYVLACQSPVLRDKLFQDPGANEVNLGNYGEHAIRGMKEYFTTGLLSPFFDQESAEVARSLTELASLAKVYALESLYSDAGRAMVHLLKSNPRFATAAYDAAGELGVTQTRLIELIQDHCPDLLLNTDTLKQLSRERLVDLFDGLEHESDGIKLLYLRKWLDSKGTTRDNLKFARGVAAKRFSLEWLLKDPKSVPIVRLSGLFDQSEVDRVLNSVSHDADAEPGSDAAGTKEVANGRCVQLTLDGEVAICGSEEAAHDAMRIFQKRPSMR